MQQITDMDKYSGLYKVQRRVDEITDMFTGEMIMNQ